MGFTAEAKNLSKYLLLITEDKPFLNIDYLKFKREEFIEGLITVSRVMLDKSLLNLVSENIKPFDYSERISLEDTFKEKFSKNKIFKEREKRIAPSIGNIKTVSTETQRFFYRGIGILKGEEVAALEDSLKGEVLFLTIGDRVEDFEVKEFSNTQLILENIRTSKRLILKRE